VNTLESLLNDLSSAPLHTAAILLLCGYPLCSAVFRLVNAGWFKRETQPRIPAARPVRHAESDSSGDETCLWAPETPGLAWAQRKEWAKQWARTLRDSASRTVRLRSPRALWSLIRLSVPVLWCHAAVVAVAWSIVFGTGWLSGSHGINYHSLLSYSAAIAILAGIGQSVVSGILYWGMGRPVGWRFAFAGWYPVCGWLLNCVALLRETLPTLVRPSAAAGEPESSADAPGHGRNVRTLHRFGGHGHRNYIEGFPTAA
jgi:hypothetical protein